MLTYSPSARLEVLTSLHLRWAGYVVRMHEDRIENVLMTNQHDTGKQNVGNLWLRCKDQHKQACFYQHALLNIRDRQTWIDRSGEADVKINSVSKDVFTIPVNIQGKLLLSFLHILINKTKVTKEWFWTSLQKFPVCYPMENLSISKKGRLKGMASFLL